MHALKIGVIINLQKHLHEPEPEKRRGEKRRGEERREEERREEERKNQIYSNCKRSRDLDF
jgi:hypothetical protein